MRELHVADFHLSMITHGVPTLFAAANCTRRTVFCHSCSSPVLPHLMRAKTFHRNPAALWESAYCQGAYPFYTCITVRTYPGLSQSLLTAAGFSSVGGGPGCPTDFPTRAMSSIGVAVLSSSLCLATANPTRGPVLSKIVTKRRKKGSPRAPSHITA